MRRAAKWLGWVLAVMVAIPLLLVGAVLIIGNTGPGRHLIGRLVPRFTGGTVEVAGLTGRFPDALHIAQVKLLDPGGAYLTLDDVTLDWSPLRLVHAEVSIDRFDAAHGALTRLPTASSGGSASLPVRVVLRTLHLGRLDVAPAVSGTPVALALDGSGVLETLDQGHGQLTAQRLEVAGRYELNGAIDATNIRATIVANEPAHGLISGIAGLPDLGAVVIDGALDGPRSALATKVAVSAGPLRATAEGQLDLQHDTADLTLSASAPAMTPRPEVSWRSVAVNAHVKGRFNQPDVVGQVRIEQVHAYGAGAASIAANVTGDAGQVQLHAELAGLRVPGASPDVLAAEPFVLDANARLDAADRPVRFTLRQKLIDAEGTLHTAGLLRGQMSLTLPDLAPLARAAGTELGGSLAVTLNAARQGDTTQLSAQGTLGITGGPAPATALIGDATHFDVAATVQGQDVALSRLRINGKSATVSASGTFAAPSIDLNWTIALNDLVIIAPGLSGELHAQGHVGGAAGDLAVAADIGGEVGARGVSSGPLTARLEARGLPSAPSAKLTAQGALLGAPLDLSLAADSSNGVVHLTIDRADWKSAHADGTLSLMSPALVPEGKLHFSMQRIADIAPLLGRPVGGSATAAVDATTEQAHVTIQVRGGDVPGTAAVSNMLLDATIDQPGTHPSIDGRLTLDGVAASGLRGSARLEAKGPADALALTLSATLPDLYGAAAQISAGATLDAQAQTLTVASLKGDWHQQALRLLAPVHIAFADGVAIDRLRLGLRQAVLEASGRVGSTLDLTASLRNLPADIASTMSPSLAADGTIDAQARLTGTTSRPEGSVRFTATGLRARTGPGRALPATNATATATLAGAEARIDARATAGRSHVTLTGRAPLATSGALDLHAAGLLDLAMLDPLLTANGRRVRGEVSLDTAITGNVASPRIAGSAQITGGEVQDFASGIHIASITARLEAAGDMVKVVRFQGRAGSGTLSAQGHIGVLQAGMPIDLTITMHNARPLASDLLTADLDADITVRGQVAEQLTVAGTVHVDRAEVRVPEKLPSGVATIPVRNAGAPPPVPAPPPLSIALNLTLNAPSQVFVRGRGLDAELGGTIHVHGTLAHPLPDGGFTLRRGQFSVAGHTLNFTSGTISFSGAGLTDPSLHLVATSINNSVTATLTIGGTARDPKITLSSVPELPQDEVLAQLLFGTSVGKLSAFQVAEIAAALASLAGAPSGITDPLASVREKLGLDVLSMGSSSSGSPTLEAGRYIAPRVYLGARQSTSGGGTQATVQVDITKGLKLQTTVGTGGGDATGAASSSNGTGVGLTYQFEY